MAIPASKYKDIAFSTLFNYQRLSTSGSFDFALPNAAFVEQVFSVAHNLGYKPYFKVWIKFPSGRIYSGVASPNTYENPSGVEVDEIYVTNTHLNVRIANFSGNNGGSGTVYYRIYEEQAI